VAGWRVVEANPVAGWLFDHTGLLGGLAIDSAVTLAAVAFLIVTPRFGSRTKAVFLSLIALTTGYAVANNFQAISALGISPLRLG
jgi:hypothetical protein